MSSDTIEDLLHLALSFPKRRETVLKELFKQLEREGYNNEGQFHFGRELEVNEEGHPLCDGCKKPLKTDTEGVVLQGWVMAAAGEGQDTRGGLVGNGNHMGPHAYCHDCFVDAATFNNKNWLQDRIKREEERKAIAAKDLHDFLSHQLGEEPEFVKYRATTRIRYGPEPDILAGEIVEFDGRIVRLRGEYDFLLPGLRGAVQSGYLVPVGEEEEEGEVEGSPGSWIEVAS